MSTASGRWRLRSQELLHFCTLSFTVGKIANEDAAVDAKSTDSASDGQFSIGGNTDSANCARKASQNAGDPLNVKL